MLVPTEHTRDVFVRFRTIPLDLAQFETKLFCVYNQAAEGVVHDYRVYTILDGNHIAGVPTVMACRNDEEAIEKARQRVNGRPVEIWQGTRCVFRIEPKTYQASPTNPPCPKCGAPMRVTLAMPAGPDQEVRTFHCNACGRSETASVNYADR